MVSHRPSELAVQIKADLNVPMWELSRFVPRRVAFCRALSEGVEGIREAWLPPRDRTALISLFQSLGG